jgi:iron complex outermembrane receptor protein
MRFLLLTLLSTVFFNSASYSQRSGKVTGLVKNADETGATQAGVTVSLLRAKDSGVVKITVSDKDGAYTFERLANGKYFIAATFVGYKKASSAPFEINPGQQTVEVPTIKIMQLPKSLSGVTVTAHRPLIEQKIDRTIVNVDATITNIGTSALEVLEKAPGVTVDNEGKISLKGKEGVLIMIDGRPTQLSATDLANMLRNMSSTQMDQVEIMTNPPARYDAAGNAGIINIKTKKNTTVGYNGSLTATYMQGRYPKMNEGFNFNYRAGKVNVFTNLNHNYREGFGKLNIQRNIRDNSTSVIENYFDQQSDKLRQGSSYNGKIGLDYFVSKKTTVGIVVNGTSSPSRFNNQNVTNISTPSKVLESVTRATVDENNEWKSFSTNLNFRTLLDAKGKELTADLDYLTYGSTNRQFMVNSYFDAAGGTFQKADTLQGYLPQDIKVYSGRLDYTNPISKTSKFEAGIKSSIVRTDNNAIYDSIQYGSIVRDLNRSNHFIYEENINAAYANMNTALSKKWSAQLGLRLENTNAKGRQLTTGENFDRHYTQLFPTAYFQYKESEKHSFVANYGRRVRRPDYGRLNPFIRFMDRYTYSQGNPNLKPQVSDNIELSHTYRNAVTTTLNYTATTDMIEGVIEQKGREAYSKPANIASLRQVGISVNANNTVKKWWSSSAYFNGFYNQYKGVITGAPVSLSATSFIFTTTQQFKLSKTLSAEINGRVRSPWFEELMKTKWIGMMGAGLSQQVMNNQGTLRLTVRDIFWSQRFRAEGRYSNADFQVQDVNDSRVVALGFTYRFSKGKKIAPTKRTAGSANEEQERVGGQ